MYCIGVAVFLRLSAVVKLVMMTLIALAYIFVMEYTHADIFTVYDGERRLVYTAYPSIDDELERRRALTGVASNLVVRSLVVLFSA